jgi:hypothetical protein
MNNESADEFIFIFHGARDAIMGERALLAAGVDVKVMPVPACLGSACGIALRLNPGETERAKTLLGPSVKGIYRRLLKNGNTERFVPWNL